MVKKFLCHSSWRIKATNGKSVTLTCRVLTLVYSSVTSCRRTVKRNGGDIDKAIATFKPDAEAAVEKKK